MMETKSATPIWEAQGQEKRVAVQHMFADVAPNYDRANAIMSFNLHNRWREFAVNQLNLSEGNSALDLCCGTGDFLKPLRKRVGSTGRLLGLDFCLPMLELARPKDAAILALGDACRLPVASETLNAVSVGWGIRNVPDIDEAHREIFRVLLPGGRFASLDCAEPDNWIGRLGTKMIRGRFLTNLGKLLGLKEAYQYLNESTIRFKNREQLADSMRSAGFVDVHYRDMMFGNICVHWGTKPLTSQPNFPSKQSLK